MPVHSQFGVLVIGDEILSGKRQDSHFKHVIETLRRRGMSVAWLRVTSDNHQALCETLHQTQQTGIPVLCFGGIGATPDDNTRQAAADSFRCQLHLHAEALALIEARFGAAAWPNRIRMAELPVGCLLIPNPINRIPGFSLNQHHFFPGFPELAWPMLDWVLECYYPVLEELQMEKSMRVYDVPESELIDLMEWLSCRHSEATLFSLPHLGERNSIEIGFRGRQSVIDLALDDLVSAVKRRSLVFKTLSDDSAVSVSTERLTGMTQDH